MAAKKDESPNGDAAIPGQLEGWAQQILDVLRKVAEQQRVDTTTGRPLTNEALRAVASFKETDSRLGTLKA